MDTNTKKSILIAMKKMGYIPLALIIGCFLGSGAYAQDKPNILVIWGDDVGIDNVSAYNLGMMGYKTPNIDRIAREGALFTDAYAEQTCTAGRSAFILGQHPFRTGLLTIGMQGSEHGIPDWAPTMGDVLKEQGYAIAQIGKVLCSTDHPFLVTWWRYKEITIWLYITSSRIRTNQIDIPKI